MRFLNDLLKPFAKSTFDDRRPEGPSQSPGLERIESVMQGLPAERARLLAAFALLLGRVAWIDDQLSNDEKLRIREILGRVLKIPDKQAEAVADLAAERDLCFNSDDHIVMRRIRELATPEERLDLVRALFHLAAADDISEAESEEVRRIAAALELSHHDYVALRSEFRAFLSLLKGLPG